MSFPLNWPCQSMLKVNLLWVLFYSNFFQWCPWCPRCPCPCQWSPWSPWCPWCPWCPCVLQAPRECCVAPSACAWPVPCSARSAWSTSPSLSTYPPRESWPPACWTSQLSAPPSTWGRRISVSIESKIFPQCYQWVWVQIQLWEGLK